MRFDPKTKPSRQITHRENSTRWPEQGNINLSDVNRRKVIVSSQNSAVCSASQPKPQRQVAVAGSSHVISLGTKYRLGSYPRVDLSSLKTSTAGDEVKPLTKAFLNSSWNSLAVFCKSIDIIAPNKNPIVHLSGVQVHLRDFPGKLLESPSQFDPAHELCA